MGLGRKGDRVANTPLRTLPPKRGGLTVGDHSSRLASENSQMSHRCENSSNPLTASGLRYSGSNTMVPLSDSMMPLCLGIPNLVGNSVCILAIILNFYLLSSHYKLQRASAALFQIDFFPFQETVAHGIGIIVMSYGEQRQALVVFHLEGLAERSE